MPVVRVPQPLRRLTKGQSTVQLSAATIGQSLDAMEKAYPGIKERIVDPTGALHRFVNIYINGEDVRFLQGMETKVKDADEISIVPAVAGGAV